MRLGFTHLSLALEKKIKKMRLGTLVNLTRNVHGLLELIWDQV